jgi:aminopeptidase-like protein
MAMDISRDVLLSDDQAELGNALHGLAARLYPICRSITGPGVRETLTILSEFAAITFTEVPSGTDVFDWTIPNEWSIHDAYIADVSGNRLIDFRQHSLHVLNYSSPISAELTFDELRPHLHTLPLQPDLIPYRTSYYKENWGFCLSQNQLETLGEGPFTVHIDSTLAPGSLTIGEIFIPGKTEAEILLSAHMCHPSLANDNLSGIVIATALAARLQPHTLNHGVRIVFLPGTIGSIAWLALNEAAISNINAGLVLTGLGDRGALTYKRSRRGDTIVDRAAEHVLKHEGNADNRVIDFSPWGYDERQYCSPGFDLPVGRLSRTPHGEYPEYHTSGDNLDLISADALAASLKAVETIIAAVDGEARYLSTNLKGEPRLGKRGLYRQTAGQGGAVPDEIAFLWILNQSDGQNSLLDIAVRSGIQSSQIRNAADALIEAGLLKAI